MKTHSEIQGRSWAVAIGALLVALATASIAQAHGIGSEDPNRPVAEYLWLGFKHLIVGWDHVLFILGIVLLAGNLWRATKLITLFVLGHSITLMLATTQEWTVSTTFVDIVIALSLVFVAVVALRFGRPENWMPFGIALFVIGLIHGLGLATRLLALGVSDNDLAWRILAFNVGVELGQAAAVIGFSAILYALARWAPTFRRTVLTPAFVLIATGGIVGAAVIAVNGSDESGRATIAEEQTETTPAESERQETSESQENSESQETCVQTPAETPPLNNAGHPDRRFYGPDEPIPQANFDHILGDGYVVVTYDPEIQKQQVAELRRLVEADDKAVVAGAVPGQTEPLVASTAYYVLTCTKVDIPELTAFRDAWFLEIYG